MTVTLYGQSGSRAVRCLWMLEELGIEYAHEPTTFSEQAKAPAFKQINPFARIPALVDGDLQLGESMAINLYLARAYDGGLAAGSLADEARATHYSFWVMTEVEKTLLNALCFVRGLFGLEPSAEKAAKCFADLAPAFARLEEALAERPYLLGETFSVADLNVASVLLWARNARADLAAYPLLDAWLERCLTRPALARAQAMP
ncbi:MAG: glutathione S-transferase family protein [Pseudomonadota bacterium]